MSWSGSSSAAEWGGTLAATSDYVFRGVSRTDGHVAVQAGLQVRAAERWFAGAWASSLDSARAAGGDLELNLHAGRGWDLSDDWAASLAWVRYLYPDAADRGASDWDELSASALFQDRVALTASISPNSPSLYAGSGRRRRTTSIEASWRESIAGRWSVVAAAGRHETRGPSNRAYLSWNVGLSAHVDALEFSLVRFGVDSAGRRQFGAAAADRRWVLSVIWRFAAD